MLGVAIRHRGVFVVCFLAACILSFGLVPFVGQDFFPSVDSGEFKIHLRAPTGTRIEDVADLCDRVENDIRSEIPPSELVTILDNIGLPYSNINLSYSTSAPIGPGDADIQVELAPKHHTTEDYVRSLRSKLGRDFPGVAFYELPVGLVTQILNFGLPAASRYTDCRPRCGRQSRFCRKTDESPEVHSWNSRPADSATL